LVFEYLRLLDGEQLYPIAMLWIIVIKILPHSEGTIKKWNIQKKLKEPIHL